MKMKVIFYRGILSFSFTIQISVYDKSKGTELLSCHMRKPISYPYIRFCLETIRTSRIMHSQHLTREVLLAVVFDPL